MKKNIYHTAAFALCFFCAFQSPAQENDPLYSKSLSLGVNSDAFTGLDLGYLQESSISGLPSCYYVTLNIPLLSSIAQKKLDTWEIKAGAKLELIRLNRFTMLTDLSLFSIRHKQSLGTFLPFGFNLKITPAYRVKNGYIGFQTMFKQVLFTHIRHSDYVKERYNGIYDSNGGLMDIEPQNGFYQFTGNHLYYGIEGMFQLSNKLNMYVDLGLINYLSHYTGMFDSMMFGQIPFYTHIHFNYDIGRTGNY